MTTDDLARMLYRALVLTKGDAEKHGFTYGDQSVCNEAIEAFKRWDSARAIRPQSLAREGYEKAWRERQESRR